MARKETVTYKIITEAAFEMAKDEGFEAITARKLANRIGCSTQPIFRVFTNMEDLWNTVYGMASDYFLEYYNDFSKISDVPFCNLGLAYINFAREEQNLFRLLFVSDVKNKKSLYELLNGKSGNVMNEINNAKMMGCRDAQGMFMKMWIFIHGAACMCLTGDYDLGEKETKELLENSYVSFK